MTPSLSTFHSDRAHSIKTKKAIDVCMRHWQRLELDEINSESLATYRDLRLAERAAAATVRGELNKLRAFGRYLGNRCEVVLPQEPVRIPTAWSREQLARLFNEARRTDRTIFGLPGRLYYPALIGAAYDSGERIGALVAVEWGQFDLEARTLIAPAETRKGRRRDMLHLLSRDTVEALAALRAYTRASDHQKVFGLGSSSTLWKSYSNILDDAGLPNDRRSKFQKLRRTAGTEIERAGGDACDFLGHADPRTTRKHYLDPRSFKKRLPWRPGSWLRWLGL